MSRFAASVRRGRRHGNPVALFPFLAVLVCTMGALIVVLIVLTRQSRIQAAQTATAKTVELRSDLEAAQRISAWRRSEMSAANQKAQAKLAESRLQLGHVEQHARQLQEKLAQLDAQWQELQRPAPETGRQREDLAAERDRLAVRIAEAERELAGVRKASSERPKSYAVIPYHGPNGTHRRPLFIECRPDAIILQPEGIVFREADFPEPLGPGNPLDTALRAARESLLARKQIQGDGSDEPYPLLLVRPGGIAAYYVARQAIKTWKAELGYEFVGEDWELAFPQPDAALAQAVGGAVALAREEQRQKAMLSMLASANQQRPTYRAAPGGGLIREGGPEEDATTPRDRTLGAFGSRHDSQGALGQASQPPPPAAGTKAASPGDDSQTRPKTAHPLRPGEWIPTENLQKHKLAEKDDPSSKPSSLTQSRGKDWGLPGAARGSVPVTRPIRVDCFPDQSVILPEAGAGRSRAIPFSLHTEDSVDSLVSAVWEHMKAWGIAGRGMYWRPILKVRVAPGAESRYLELKALLKGSGLEMERRDEATG